MKVYVLFKRLLDILFSLFLLIFLSPLFIILAVLIRLDSKGPAIFVQTRIGHNKKRFDMYKFRTMVVGAELQQNDLMSKNEAHFPAFKIKNDPRLTKFGKKLRKTGLDELPQLLNILKGEMSFIGFRPPLPEEVKHYKKWHMKRFVGVPGILSFWVVEGEHNLSFDEWIKLDIKYAEKISMADDCYIFLKFIRMFFGFFSKKIFGGKLFYIFSSKRKHRTIIFYVNYVKGLGHLSRTMKLSNEICRNNPKDKVIILTDTKLIGMFNPRCEIIKLPALDIKTISDSQEVCISDDKYKILELRKNIINSIVKSYRPDFFFIDYRPKGLCDELEGSIRRMKKKPYLVLRDILDDPAETKKSWDSGKFIEFIRKQYSGVFVFGDKKIFDMSKKYSFERIDDKIKYFGYIVNSENYVRSSKKRILITVGSGCVGYNIIRKVLDCGNFKDPVRVITGPAMKKEHYLNLKKKYASVEFVKYETDMITEYNEASLVISMGGYNTSTEILESDVPVLIIPLEEPDNLEQLVRAKLFKKHNLCNYISFFDITKKTLSDAISESKKISLKRKVSLKKIRLDGAKNFLDYINRIK